MTRTRLGAGAVVAALVGGWIAGAAPAGAAPQSPPTGPPIVAFTDPCPSASQPPVETTSTPTMKGTVQPRSSGGTVTSVEIQITSKDGHPGATFSATPSKQQSSNQQCQQASNPQWTFTAAVPSSQALAWNGQYTVTGQATENDSGSSFPGQQSAPVNFAEGVTPQPPTGVSASKNAAGSAATVSWQANPEPDIVGYQVQRASLNGSDWSTISPGSHITDTNYQDSSVQRGTDYQYRVIAVRSGALPNSQLFSSPSSAASTAVPAIPLFGPGGPMGNLPSAVQAITDPVAGLVQPGRSGRSGPVTGSPTYGGYSNLPISGRASLAEPGTPAAQDPNGGSGPNLLRTALFVAAALILLAIAAHLIRVRRAVDEGLEPIGVDQWDRHAGGADETAEVATVGAGRRSSDVTRAMAAQRERSDATGPLAAQRKRADALRALAASRRR